MLAGGLVRQTVTAFVTSQFGPNYATNSSIHLRRLPKSREVKNASGQRVAFTEYFYDESSPASYGDISGHCSTATTISGTCALTASRGNPTRVVRWKDATASVTQSQTFDIAGNVLSATDGRGYTTTASYADDFTTTTNLQGGQATHAHPTQVTQPAPFSFTSKTKYDYYLGRPTLSEDANGVQTTFTYESGAAKLDRLAEAVRAANKDASVKQKTTFSYNDTSAPISVETVSDQISFLDQRLRSRVEFDGLGRQRKAIQFEDSDQIETEKQYDAGGRAYHVSNPRRPAQAFKWTTTDYDALGRVKTTTTPDGAVAATDYDRNYATVTDQDSNTRKSKTDALGRVTQVWEDPTGLNYTTGYTYDELDNLTGVTQDGQTRTLVYDWLGRLKSALNPETGPVAVSYTYDNNGNLETRTDARGTTSSSYDGLNRIMVKTYSHGGAEATPAAAWCYDGKTCSGGACTGSITADKKGLLTAAGNSRSVTSFDQFDDLGRVKASTQTTEGQSYGFGYTFNLAGGLTQVTYPSGKAIGYSFDKAGRVSGVSGYTSGVQYRAHGAMSQMTLGNGLVEKWEYNEDRLQPVSIRLGTSGSPSSVLELGLEYCPGGDCTKNNGNVRQQAITVPSMAALTQAYTYDAVNRLKVAAENPASLSNPACPDSTSQWCQKFGYDARGNRSVAARSNLGISPIEPVSFDQNNRIADSGWVYDGSGNAKQNPANETFTYDGENRLIASAGTAAASYAYDGDGRRVKRVAGGATTVYVYDAAGQLAAEYTAGGSAYTGRRYLTADHLGTTRVITDGTGQVVERRDYHPFGEEILVASGTPRAGVASYTSDAALALKFTGKERDSETGLDYFGARHMSSVQGRWTSPDRINLTSKRLLNPSNTLNKYVYAANNPLKYVDSDGEDITVFYRRGLFDTGHIQLTAFNQGTGRVASLDFVPDAAKAKAWQRDTPSMALETRMPSDMVAYSSLTIRTTPEEAQKVIEWIEKFKRNRPNFTLLSTNCTTTCVEALRILGVDVDPEIINPDTLWDALFPKYSTQPGLPTLGHYPAQPGREYGNQRYPGMSTYDLGYLYYQLWLNEILDRREPQACVEVLDSASGTRSEQCDQ